MTKTDIIIFSKNRSLQLKSLLRSIRHYSDITDDEINVLYTTTSAIPYDELISEFGCRFVPQGDFLSDLKGIVERSSNDYVMFMVDDLIFKDDFSLRGVESFLDANPLVDCFAPRMGKNIEEESPPQFSILDDGILTWDTAKGLGRLWNYFWEVSSSIYRKGLVTEYLDKCSSRKVSFPNPLESHYYVRMPTHRHVGSGLKRLLLDLRFLGTRRTNRVACFEQSKCFTIGVNQVANKDMNYREIAGPEELHGKMKEGFIVDYHSIRQADNAWPNAGSKFFRLVRERTAGAR